jgi:hypothetical protein
MSDRTYGQGTWGDGNYGGPPQVWDSLQGPAGPPGDQDLLLYRSVSAPVVQQANWVPQYSGYGQGTVYRDRQGVCWINTVAQWIGSGTFAAGAIPFYVPPGFWPLNRVMLPTIMGDPAVCGRLDINTDGGFQINSPPSAGNSYAMFDAIWNTVVPASYVINGCAITNLTRGTGNLYNAYWGPGRYLEYLPGVWTTSGGNVGVTGNATAGNWNLLVMYQGQVLCFSTTPGGAAMTTETSALQNYYANCLGVQAWGAYTLLATFASTGAGVTPTFNDRRWLPYTNA